MVCLGGCEQEVKGLGYYPNLWGHECYVCDVDLAFDAYVWGVHGENAIAVSKHCSELVQPWDYVVGGPRDSRWTRVRVGGQATVEKAVLLLEVPEIVVAASGEKGFVAGFDGWDPWNPSDSLVRAGGKVEEWRGGCADGVCAGGWCVGGSYPR